MTTTLIRVTVEELCEREEISPGLLADMVAHDIARPMAGANVAEWVFDATAVHWLNTAVRLQRDLELDWVAVAMMVDLLRQREELHRENRCLKQRLERFLSGGEEA